MKEVIAVFLVALLVSAGYAAGRLHGQLNYRLGYRFGYRQGYFDGDRASWNRRRRELQAAVASVLKAPTRADTFTVVGPRAGTTYKSAAHAGAGSITMISTGTPDTGWHRSEPDRLLIDAVQEA